jgi:lipid II:glycine glycyltransferase (peptidoglycan interpeptide bridge formation enzyme)
MPYDPEIARRMIAALKDEYVVRRGLLLRLLPPVFETDPFAASYQSALTAAGFEQRTDTRRYRTVRVDLSPSIEQVRKKLGAKWRNKLNGAEKNGLTVTQGASVEHYAKFLAAYREMMARKNFETTVDVEEFARIQSDLPEALRMQVFLSEKDGTVMNALVVSAMGDTAVYLLGATSDEGLKLKGAYLLQWRAIQWLKERNCRWYELGGIDPVQNPGVYEFKSGFGGEEVHDLGVFEASGSWASRFCVKAAEHARSLTEKLRSWNRRPATVPKG